MTASSPPALRILRADYANPTHTRDLLSLLDAYARDPAGGGAPLSAYAREHLVRTLAARADAFSVLAYDGDAPVGLVNAFEGFSTFAARPLVNVHDVVVLASHRGQRIGERMLEEVERIARARGLQAHARSAQRQHASAPPLRPLRLCTVRTRPVHGGGGVLTEKARPVKSTDAFRQTRTAGRACAQPG